MKAGTAIQRSIAIDASPERVWSIIADVERWAEWTPSITSVEPLDPGGLRPAARFRIRQPKLPTTVWQVVAVEPGLYFDWTAGMPGFTSRGHHRVEARGAGVLATLSIEHQGFLTPILGRMFEKITREYVGMEAEGLKRRAEGSA